MIGSQCKSRKSSNVFLPESFRFRMLTSNARRALEPAGVPLSSLEHRTTARCNSRFLNGVFSALLSQRYPCWETDVCDGAPGCECCKLSQCRLCGARRWANRSTWHRELLAYRTRCHYSRKLSWMSVVMNFLNCDFMKNATLDFPGFNRRFFSQSQCCRVHIHLARRFKLISTEGNISEYSWCHRRIYGNTHRNLSKDQSLRDASVAVAFRRNGQTDTNSITNSASEIRVYAMDVAS